MNTDILDTLLDIAPEETPTDTPETTAIAQAVDAEIVAAPAEANTSLVPLNSAIHDRAKEEEELEKDFQHARSKITNLIDHGRNAAELALELAEAGDSPRAYEVVGTLITATVNASKELVNLHGIKRETRQIDAPTSADGGASPIRIDKAVFVGRAQDLIREVKKIRQGMEEKE